MADVRHRFVTVDGAQVFYREAGRVDAPSVLLLHGFPSSSIQFRYLLRELSDDWDLVAPCQGSALHARASIASRSTMMARADARHREPLAREADGESAQ
jgi:pimeloyl-ACP methyl ester carboxylesterase